MKRFFTEYAKNLDKPIFGQFGTPIEQPAISSNFQGIDNFDPAFINPPNAGYSCPGGCPRSCIPLCTPECCFPHPNPDSDTSALLKIFMDSSKSFTPPLPPTPPPPPQTTPIYQSTNINQELMDASFQPLIQGLNYQPPPMEIVQPQAYSIQQISPPKDDVDEKGCKFTCSLICTTDCPKECCAETPKPLMDLSTEPPKDEKDTCLPECDLHCTPSCLYSHCCKD